MNQSINPSPIPGGAHETNVQLSPAPPTTSRGVRLEAVRRCLVVVWWGRECRVMTLACPMSAESALKDSPGVLLLFYVLLAEKTTRASRRAGESHSPLFRDVNRAEIVMGPLPPGPPPDL